MTIWMSAPLSTDTMAIALIGAEDAPVERSKISAMGAPLAASSAAGSARTATTATPSYTTERMKSYRFPLINSSVL